MKALEFSMRRASGFRLGNGLPQALRPEARRLTGRCATEGGKGAEAGSRIVTVNGRMQRGYRYELIAPTGSNFDPEFRPELTPKEMLWLGVFCGKYMTDTRDEFPASWFAGAKLATEGRDCSLNFFGVDASQPLSVWRQKGWTHPDDPRAGSNGIPHPPALGCLIALPVGGSPATKHSNG